MTYWQGNDTSVRTDTERGRPRKLTLENDFFAVFVRIKLGLFLEDIANRFDMSSANVFKIFNTWTRFLSLELKILFRIRPLRKYRDLCQNHSINSLVQEIFWTVLKLLHRNHQHYKPKGKLGPHINTETHIRL